MSKMRIQDSGKYKTHFTLFSSDRSDKQTASPTAVMADNLFLESDDYMAIHFADETFFIWVGCIQIPT